MARVTDWADDPEARAFLLHALEEMAPKMDGSAFVMQLVPDDVGEPKFWVELGASIMMDKPILAVVTSDRPIPEKLRLIADEIVTLDQGLATPKAKEQIAEALQRMQEKGE